VLYPDTPHGPLRFRPIEIILPQAPVLDLEAHAPRHGEQAAFEAAGVAERAVLVSLSRGAERSLHLAASNPERVDKLVFIAPALPLPQPAVWIIAPARYTAPRAHCFAPNIVAAYPGLAAEATCPQGRSALGVRDFHCILPIRQCAGPLCRHGPRSASRVARLKLRQRRVIHDVWPESPLSEGAFQACVNDPAGTWQATHVAPREHVHDFAAFAIYRYLTEGA
jgi:pimeloyl-ACP methyl ester carboxylesterase